MGAGICGTALLRAADAMLRAIGKETITLLLPSTAMAGDVGGQLGLVDPGVMEVVISPAAARDLGPETGGPRRRIQFTLPASVIVGQLPGLGMGSADDLFSAALGINYGDSLFHIESVTPESYAGTICFYVVTAVE